MMKRYFLIAFAAVFSAALPVAAAEGGEANIFAGDLGNMIWTLVVFGLVIFILGKFAWGPLLSVLQERESYIRDSLEKAKNEREAAEAQLAAYSAKLDSARADATGIVEEGRRDAEVVRRRIEKDARQEAEKLLGRAKLEIDIAKQTAIKELFTASAALATTAAGKIIGKELRAADHERLIAESISELEKMESN